MVVNTYSQCDVQGKRRLSHELLLMRRSSVSANWFLIGDFSVVRRPEERREEKGNVHIEEKYRV